MNNLPIFHRYDYSIPIENSVPGDKGKPMFLMDVLKEDESDFYTDEYKYTKHRPQNKNVNTVTGRAWRACPPCDADCS